MLYVHRDTFVICVLDCTGIGKTADIQFCNLSRIREEMLNLWSIHDLSAVYRQESGALIQCIIGNCESILGTSLEGIQFISCFHYQFSKYM